MRGIAIPMLAVAAPLLAELPPAGAAPLTPVPSASPPLARDMRRDTLHGARRAVPTPAVLATRLPAHRGGYQVHNGRVARDAATA